MSGWEGGRYALQDMNVTPSIVIPEPRPLDTTGEDRLAAALLLDMQDPATPQTSAVAGKSQKPKKATSRPKGILKNKAPSKATGQVAMAGRQQHQSSTPSEAAEPEVELVDAAKFFVKEARRRWKTRAVKIESCKLPEGKNGNIVELSNDTQKRVENLQRLGTADLSQGLTVPCILPSLANAADLGQPSSKTPETQSSVPIDQGFSIPNYFEADPVHNTCYMVPERPNKYTFFPRLTEDATDAKTLAEAHARVIAFVLNLFPAHIRNDHRVPSSNVVETWFIDTLTQQMCEFGKFYNFLWDEIVACSSCWPYQKLRVLSVLGCSSAYWWMREGIVDRMSRHGITLDDSVMKCRWERAEATANAKKEEIRRILVEETDEEEEMLDPKEREATKQFLEDIRGVGSWAQDGLVNMNNSVLTSPWMEFEL